MGGIISTLFGGLILFPFIITLTFLLVVRKMGRAPASVIGLAADVTTPFLFLTIYVVSHTIFGDGVGVYIAGSALMIAIVYVVVERFNVKEFQIVRIMRKTWRMYFLLLLAAYFLLLVGGIMVKIVEYAN